MTLSSNALPPRRPARGLLAVALYSALTLAVLIVAAVAYLLIAPPLGPVRDHVIARLEERTGRAVTVAGPLSVSLFPQATVSLGGIAMAPPEGMDGGPTLTVPSIDVEMPLWSLLSRRPLIERVTLHRPAINLVVDTQGRRSWDLRKRETSPSPGTGAQPVPQAPMPRPVEVRVIDAVVNYRDDRSATSTEISGLELSAVADRSLGGSNASGTFTWDGVPFRFSASRAPQSAQILFKLEGEPLELSYDGSLAYEGGVTADGAITIGHLAYKDLKIGPSKLALSARHGGVRVTLHDAEVYGGHAQGSLMLETKDARAATASLTLKDVAVMPLLKDAAGMGWLDGRGTVTLQLKGRGTGKQLAETLQGQVRVAVADGSLTGLDAEKLSRALEHGRLDRLIPRREDRTPFRALIGTFDIADGIAKNQDLKLDSAHLQLSGSGTIELAPRRIDYTLLASLPAPPPPSPAPGAAPAEPQPEAGAPDASGTSVNASAALELPIGIKGPLDRPEITIKGQEQLTDTIKQIGRNLRSREVQDAIKGLLSGDREQRMKPAELMEKLLKKE